MSSKGRNVVRLETEIEKNREDSKWLRVIELAEQLKQGSPNQEALADFLLGEGKLECFLEEHAPTEENISVAQSGLKDAEKHLLNSTSEAGRKARVALDSNLLLGKLSYACGKYADALQYYNNAELDTLTEKELPCRGLRIVAESYAIKGLSLEKLPLASSSKYKVAEREESVIKYFELAADLTLLYFQELDRLAQQQQITSGGTHSPTPSHPSHPSNAANKTNVILETALQRAPLLHLKAGQVVQAVERYRSLLTAVASSGMQSRRLQLAQQLAELLMRGFTGNRYSGPQVPTQSSFFKAPAKTSGGIGESPWKPRQYSNINMFIPKIDQEEIILALLIAEELAVRDAVLSQAAEFQVARRRALDAASTIYDLLAIAVMRWKQAGLINELLERAMKFSFKDPHIWSQRALCLISIGRHFQALAVLKEVSQLSPERTLPCLLASRICYEFLERPKEGSDWADEALKRENSQSQPNLQLVSRCHLYKGIGLHLQAQNTSLKGKKEQLLAVAFEQFTFAQQSDPNDHLSEFYLALNLANRSRVADAIGHARNALELCAEHAPSLQLLALLLSAQKRYQEAQEIIEATLNEYPNDLHALNIKVHLELLCEGPQAALLTSKKMLSIWKNEYEEQTVLDLSDLSERRSETRSVFQLYSTEMSDKDTGSLHAQSIAASRVEHALSEVASSLSSFVPRPGPQQAWLLQAQIWLLIAQVYLELGEISYAEACVHEASVIFPLSHHVFYMRGLIYFTTAQLSAAKQWLENAVAVCPSHVRSLQQLGIVYYQLGSTHMAEKTLRDAARLDPSAHRTWFALGQVLQQMGDAEAAAACMATATECERVAPILDYSVVGIVFQ